MLDQIIALAAGTLIGLLMAIPVGPVGLIVFKRSMFKSRVMGLTTGMGAALTDGFLASIGAFGLKAIWHFVVVYQTPLRIMGGLIILITGLYGVFVTYRPKPEGRDPALTVLQHFISGVVLTGTNPLAALSFFVIFASIGHRLGIGSSEGVATALVTGVVIGSSLWWLILTFIGKKVGHKVKPEHIDLINKFFGIIIALLGAAMLIGALLK